LNHAARDGLDSIGVRRSDLKGCGRNQGAPAIDRLRRWRKTKPNKAGSGEPFGISATASTTAQG
jgi:hypothetical protein